MDESDLGKLYDELVTDRIGLCNVVEDRLVVKDLARGNGSRGTVLDGVKEGTDLLIEVRGRTCCGNDLRNLGLHLLACHLVIQNEIAADGTVPALGRGDTETALSAENDGITGSVDIHRPSDTEVDDNTALKTDKACGEIVNAEELRILGVTGSHVVGVLRIGAEERRLIARNGVGLG